MTKDEARRQLCELLSRDESEIELDRAALLIAAEEYPRLEVEAYLARLDDFAATVRSSGPEDESPLERLQRLRDHLFVDLGFRGNRDDYFDARNSFLNDVIDRRLGIPITLSVVLMEVARRIGLELRGIGMPGHFIVGFFARGERRLLDPFNEGREMSEEDCRALIGEMYGGTVSFHPAFLRPVGKRQILARMLQNLKGIYAKARDYSHQLGAAELALIVTPGASTEIRDRGLALAGLGRYNQARTDLEAYLRAVPDAEDEDQIREQIGLIKQRQAQMN